MNTSQLAGKEWRDDSLMTDTPRDKGLGPFERTTSTQEMTSITFGPSPGTSTAHTRIAVLPIITWYERVLLFELVNHIY